MRPIPFLRINTRIILLIMILVLITALMAIPAELLASQHHKVVVREIQIRAQSIATSIAAMIENEAERYRSLSNVQSEEALSQEDRDFYLKMNGILHQITASTEAQFIFTERKVDSRTIAYVLDGTDPGSPDFSPLGTEENMRPVEETVYRERTTFSTDLVVDPVWGKFITGYAPIIDPREGTVLGLVGVDYSADYIRSITRTMYWLITISFFFIILLVSSGIYSIHQYQAKNSIEDYLTKLRSRRYFSRYLKQEILFARKTRNSFCLLMIDVDWFKQVTTQWAISPVTVFWCPSPR